MPLTVAQRQARYRDRLREQRRAIHELPGLPASHRDRLARIIALERTQLRGAIAKLRRKRGRARWPRLRDAERALRWWAELLISQNIELEGEG